MLVKLTFYMSLLVSLNQPEHLKKNLVSFRCLVMHISMVLSNKYYQYNLIVIIIIIIIIIIFYI